METSKNHLIRNFLRNGRLRVNIQGQKLRSNNSLYLGIFHSNHKKLDLDDFNHGAYKGTVNFWFRELEFNIQRDIAKIYHRFTNFTVQPLIWRPCFKKDSAENSEKFGIPWSPAELKDFKNSGLCVNTPVEFLSIS